MRVVQSRIFAFAIAVAVSGSGLIGAIAQTKRTAPTSASQTASALVASLPASDGVVSIDAQRLLNGVLPGVLANETAKLAEVNARIDDLKTRTGIDLRQFDRIVVGIRFITTSPDKLRAESVAIAQGRFNAPATVLAGISATKDKYTHREESYGGKTIYIFKPAEIQAAATAPADASKNASLISRVIDGITKRLFDVESGEVAVVALDQTTIAIGQLNRVREAIDAKKGKGRVSAELTGLALRNPNAVVGFGANMPTGFARYVGFEGDDVAKNLDAIRQVYGSVAQTGSGYQMLVNARADGPDQARGVYNTVVGFRDLAGYFAGNLAGDKGELAKAALANLKVTREANEVLLALDLAQSDVAKLVKIF